MCFCEKCVCVCALGICLEALCARIPVSSLSFRPGSIQQDMFSWRIHWHVSTIVLMYGAANRLLTAAKSHTHILPDRCWRKPAVYGHMFPIGVDVGRLLLTFPLTGSKIPSKAIHEICNSPPGDGMRTCGQSELLHRERARTRDTAANPCLGLLGQDTRTH